MNREELFRDAVARLTAAGIDNPRLEARLLIEHARDRVPASQDDSLAPIGGEGGGEGVRLQSSSSTPPHPNPLPQWGRGDALFESLLARRIAREPLAYVLGHKEFWSLEFETGPGALVPRPETETLIEAALRAFPDRAAPLRILDLGCGSGCLIVTALTLYPSAAGTAVDLLPAALAWTGRNALRHSVQARLELREGGWKSASGPFDLILSNPPYLATAELAGLEPELGYEPRCALESGPDGLEAYRAIAGAAPGLLAPEGRLILELGAGQREPVSALICRQGLEIVRIDADLAGIARALTARRRT